MDPLSDVISALELRNHLVGGFAAGGRWSVSFEAHEGVKCYAVASGGCWIMVDGAERAVRLEEGDCFLLPRGQPFRIGSDLDDPSDDWKRHFCTAEDGSLVTLNGGSEVTVLGGHFNLVGPQVEMLYGILPPIVHLHRPGEREALRWVFDRLRQELKDRKPGGFLMAQQLAAMILIQALRLHLDRSNGVGWFSALSDPCTGAAIAAIHREPARRWTVASLALEAGMSRSSFAARFVQLVGDGPIEYLTRWRMILAGRRLTRGEPLDNVAYSLGYKSPSAFRAAFKRTTGRTPRHYALTAREVFSG
ncbi:AraC family transcriptional regulator [Sphingomonas sp. CGMCC 1.13654]|uniref:AraC family transcriptional regulator n=1 Tax=Sphingomonas chungangi TaxID=2683589 RepID=A0A838L2H0_9SPHN|nr:AraC family transcriptional regulator [Sphingomonas chungangi]MBA2933581.1 AraC family transcriptional regulator [Sphingomonas chungangi]MVW54914.1 helix-turn-helix domain-containing protein [Sphingomonas chungangi]